MVTTTKKPNLKSDSSNIAVCNGVSRKLHAYGIYFFKKNYV